MLRKRADADRPLQPWRFRGIGILRVCALAAVLVLSACALSRPHAPAARPSAKVPRSVRAAPTPGVPVLDPRSQEPDKKRIKPALEKNSHDSLASSEVGYYMDVLQGRLTQMAGNNIGVDRHGDRIILDLSSRSGFETGSAQINPGFREVLTPLSKVLIEYRMTLVSVHVGADDAGTQAPSPLAGLRAQALAHYLAKAGVADKRIVIVRSDPDDLPAAKMHQKNGVRVELQLEPVVRGAGVERQLPGN